MNQVATDYAHRNRYQFNGKKSNVMAFNANEAVAEQVQSEPWVLFGEVVKVSTSYKYLGVELLSNLNNWAPYLHRAIAKARRVSGPCLVLPPRNWPSAPVCSNFVESHR